MLILYDISCHQNVTKVNHYKCVLPLLVSIVPFGESQCSGIFGFVNSSERYWGNMWSLAKRMAKYSRKAREDIQTERGGQTERQSRVGVAHERLPRGLAAREVFGWIFTRVLSEYCHPLS